MISAETIADFDDLTFMLLPRLPGLAHRAWSPANSASSPITVTACTPRQALDAIQLRILPRIHSQL